MNISECLFKFFVFLRVCVIVYVFVRLCGCASTYSRVCPYVNVQVNICGRVRVNTCLDEEAGRRVRALTSASERRHM